MFEDAGLVDPHSAYLLDLERVVNPKGHDLKTMVGQGLKVRFDPKTKVGELCTPIKHVAEGKEILIFNIAIGQKAFD